LAGRRARTGRGWDAAPARPRRKPKGATDPTGSYAVPIWDGAPWPDGAEAREQRNTTPAAPYSRSRSRTDHGAANDGGRSDAAAAKQPPTDSYEAAREICLRQLAVRPRTRAELAKALQRRGVDEEVAASVLDRYDEVGLIDDAAFARAWVTSRHAGRGLARRALANELRQRGVDSDLVNAALDDLDGETEAATARALVDRKIRTMGSAPPEAMFRRLVGMLARKGYPAGVAVGAVKDALAARAEAAEFADQLDVDAIADAAAIPDESDSV
jgi:regulatory protein